MCVCVCVCVCVFFPPQCLVDTNVLKTKQQYTCIQCTEVSSFYSTFSGGCGDKSAFLKTQALC